MTLNLITRYPGQIITSDPAYPLGKARNRASLSDTTGTPMEADLVNDLIGANQAILALAGIVASGTPDKVGDSDVADALSYLLPRRGRAGTYSPALNSPTNISTLSLSGSAFYAIVGNSVAIVFARVTYNNTTTGQKSYNIALPEGTSTNVVGMSIERNGAATSMGTVSNNSGYATVTWNNTDTSGSRSSQLIFACVI